MRLRRIVRPVLKPLLDANERSSRRGAEAALAELRAHLDARHDALRATLAQTEAAGAGRARDLAAEVQRIQSALGELDRRLMRLPAGAPRPAPRVASENAGPVTGGATSIPQQLAPLLRDPLVVIDVGCRWGFADAWERLGDRCRCIGFEADAAEAAALRSHYAGWPNVEVVAQALGAAAGPATLHVTSEPACSSIYAPIDEVADRFPQHELTRFSHSEEIRLRPLDSWCEESGLERADVLKIDVQGAELDVLRGGTGLLRSVQVAEIEVEFNRIYRDQPLFADVDPFMRDHGFVLWRLKNLTHYGPREGRVGIELPADEYWYVDAVRSTPGGYGQLFWADAFYVAHEFAYPTKEMGWELLLRNACLASILELHDLALMALVEALAVAPAEQRGALRPVIDQLRHGLPA